MSRAPGKHMGGEVAAPVFSAVVGGALRLLAVAPDAPVNGPEDMPATPAMGTMHTAALPMSAAVAPARSLAELTAGFVAGARRHHGERSDPRQPRGHPRRLVPRLAAGAPSMG